MCQVWLKWIQWYLRRRWQCEIEQKQTDRQTNDGQHAIRNFSSGELKERQTITCFIYSNKSLQFPDLIKIDVTFAKCLKLKLKNMIPFTDMKHINRTKIIQISHLTVLLESKQLPLHIYSAIYLTKFTSPFIFFVHKVRYKQNDVYLKEKKRWKTSLLVLQKSIQVIAMISLV